MKPINIISAYQSIKAAYDENINVADIKYDFKLKKNEIQSLLKLVTILKDNGADFNCFNGYYIGYEIKQISKEFDLLRFNDNAVINIELKGTLSEETKIEKITEQMNKNFYYLNFLSKPVFIYTYVEDDGFYRYDNNNRKAIKISIDEVIKTLKEHIVDYGIDPDNLFVPSNYLISPFNNTENFLRGEYFLTDHQFNIKKEIMECIKNQEYKLFCISANAGTGKTLLMYDIAKSLLVEDKKVRIIHCGKLNEGHVKLTDEGWDIIPVKYINEATTNLFIEDKVDILIIDEAHRIRDYQLNLISKKSDEFKIPVIFSYDVKQFLSSGENKDIYELVKDRFSYIPLQMYTLSNKIRCNKELASFIKNLIKIGDSKDNLDYKNITIEYFADKEDVLKYIATLSDIDGWKPITFTNSRYTPEPLDDIANICQTKAHDVIGQEFKRVVFVMDSNFRYNDEGLLMTKKNYYSAKGMLYQIVTRAVDELKIIVYDSLSLYVKLLEIQHTKFDKNRGKVR